MRALTPTDRLIGTADVLMKILGGVAPSTGRSSPAEPVVRELGEPWLEDEDARHAAQLMRVNHAGEVAAQGLYYGQLLTAQTESTRERLEQSAREEGDHLRWCQQRLDALGDRRSLLDPFWFAGAAAMGALSGRAGDAYSLGFVEETERQVERHIDDHLARLPTSDHASRAVLETMRDEEAEHGAAAMRLGGKPLPWAVRSVLMPAVSNVMKVLAARI